MSLGKLKVVLISARGLKSGDFFSKTDAYVLLTCSTRQKRSNTASNQGANPAWNQEFSFDLDEGASELTLKIMDEDMFTADDHLGSVSIPLRDVLQKKKIPATSFSVAKPNGHYQGEIKLSMEFFPKNQDLHQQFTPYPPPGNWQAPYGSSSHGGAPHESAHVGGPYPSAHVGGPYPSPYGEVPYASSHGGAPYGSFQGEPHGSFRAAGPYDPSSHGGRPNDSFHGGPHSMSHPRSYSSSQNEGPYGSFNEGGWKS